MLRAQASRSDGDMLCQAGLKIANASANHEEDTVYKALVQTELIVNIPCTYLNLGTGVLKSHPCFKPGYRAASTNLYFPQKIFESS